MYPHWKAELIRSIMHRVAGSGQRGGLAILTAFGFMLFSVPIITGSLGLASNTSIDSRVKTGIAREHYCSLAVPEYIEYLSTDTVRWDAWLAANEDPGNPGTYAAASDLCGQIIDVELTQQSVLPPEAYTGPPLGNPLITIPPLAEFDQRNFQTLKAVSAPNPTGGDSVTYTISVFNVDSNPTSLIQIEDILPTGFSYDCTAPPDQLTLPGMAPQDIIPQGGPCPSGSNILWDMPPGTTIEPGDGVTLTFTAVTSTVPGTYCNEAQVLPGGTKTRSGKTAIVQIGPDAGLCAGEAVLITKTVDSVTLVSTDDSSVPFTYTFDVDYTITVDNIGTDELTITSFEDLLPAGFSFFSMTSPSGDINDNPSLLNFIGALGRQQVTWGLFTNLVSMSETFQQVSDDLQAIIDANPGTDLADALDEALEELDNAVDQFNEPDYPKSILDLGTATDEIQEAIDDGLFNPAQQGIDFMDSITENAYRLAEGTLAQAIANGDDPGDIADAQQALDDGDALRAAGNYQAAIVRYGDVLASLPFYSVYEFSESEPELAIASGTIKTIKYSTTAVITRGNFWSDLLVDFAGGSFPEDIYISPTDLVSVNDVFEGAATSDTGDVVPVSLQVWVGGENGVIDTWSIR